MEFDRSKLRMKSLKERIHNLNTDIILPLKRTNSYHNSIIDVAQRITSAKR